jgi:predicted transcriptional regulator of viral defense system
MKTGRTISEGLSSLLERLELERPATVTLGSIGEMAADSGLKTPARLVAHRLVKRGWLLQTRVPGVWEFAPADRAGPFSESDPFLTLKASLSRSDLPVMVALGSALWLHNLADRYPSPHELAIATGTRAPVALAEDFRVVHFDAKLPPVIRSGVPVQQPETLLLHLAHRPNAVRNWANVLEILPRLVEACSLERLQIELKDRPNATGVRLAYLIDPMAPDLIRGLGVSPAGKVWFGPRRSLKRHDARWNVADTLLPFSPRRLLEGSP